MYFRIAAAVHVADTEDEPRARKACWGSYNNMVKNKLGKEKRPVLTESLDFPRSALT